MAQKKYVSLSKLSTFLENLNNKFAALSHKHTTSDISDYVVDNELSPTSINPVQNKVIDAEFDAIANAMGALENVIDKKAESWDDLANKPFYNEHAVINWDGNTNGRDSFAIVIADSVAYNYYKVSDDVPTIDDLVGGTVTFNGETLTLISDFLIPDVGCYYLGEPAFVVIQNIEASMDGITITPPSTGIYFMNMNGAYTSNLTHSSIKTIDEVFIPDTIARKSDIPEIDSYEFITVDDIDTICQSTIS